MPFYEREEMEISEDDLEEFEKDEEDDLNNYKGIIEEDDEW